MTDIPTLANGAAPTAAPPASDPGELGPPTERAAPKPSAPRTFEQQRFAQDQAAADKTAKPPAAPEPQQPAPPAAQGEKFKVGKYEVSEQEIGELMTEKAAHDLRRATLPPTADDYKLEISPDAKLPGNVEFKFDGNDPGLQAAKAWAHSKGIDQSAFSEMLTLYASRVAQQEATLAERSRAEIEKVGINAPQRLDAVGRFITAEMGEADAKQIRALIVTDSMLRYHERMIQKIISQGSASFSQSHRVPPDSNEIPGFDNMSFAQQRFAQDQLAARRR